MMVMVVHSSLLYFLWTFDLTNCISASSTGPKRGLKLELKGHGSQATNAQKSLQMEIFAPCLPQEKCEFVTWKRGEMLMVLMKTSFYTVKILTYADAWSTTTTLSFLFQSSWRSTSEPSNNTEQTNTLAQRMKYPLEPSSLTKKYDGSANAEVWQLLLKHVPKIF